jgi:hypothetical protein
MLEGNLKTPNDQQSQISRWLDYAEISTELLKQILNRETLKLFPFLTITSLHFHSPKFDFDTFRISEAPQTLGDSSKKTRKITKKALKANFIFIA